MNLIRDRFVRRLLNVSCRAALDMTSRLAAAGWFLFGFLVTVGLSGAASAALDITAKEVKTASNQEEEIWPIRIDPTKICGLGKLLLGKSRLKELDAAFEFGIKPASLTPGWADAQQFQFANSRLTLANTPAAPSIATTAVLEKVP